MVVIKETDSNKVSEKLEPSHTARGDCKSHLGEPVWWFLKNLNINPAIPLSRYIVEATEMDIYIKTCICLLTAALSITVRYENHLSIYQPMDKLSVVYPHNGVSFKYQRNQVLIKGFVA